jgi:hypothetical protein
LERVPNSLRSTSLHYACMGCSQKVPRIIWHRRFGAPRARISLDRALLVISTCKFRRGCAMQLGGSGVTSGRGSGFCITIAHLATHCLLSSNSSPKTNISVITQPSYSPDLTPSDFWLFPTLKMSLKGKCFATMEDIKFNATVELRKIPKENFCRCFQQWRDQWRRYV